ncbi:type VI secretion system protein TssA [Paraburkholderia sartisoli]|uniref:Type VI secretion system protein ImpA n=1 Tax=Paraburkholderia sartisoli TaxID=83784 RepID=A0A1H4CM99_9BURK|nr:type VI secretion system protein TssA [Paraburkholderia sartisoli]SEA61581.1 type VI secretion system protein ImpA [Paraburkholderia sartisoli]
MNAIPTMDPGEASPVDPDALLEALPGDDPAGVSLRYDPLYQAIRTAREEDDQTLPMGDWERPLVKADWKRVASLCCDALQHRSKDFQLAAWLCEAWTYLHGIDGFLAGTRLLTALAQRYWDSAWPRIEDGDAEPRGAPFAWANEVYPQVLALHVPLLAIDANEPESISLDRWERSAIAPAPAQDDEDAAVLTRELIVNAAAQRPARTALIHMHRQLEEAGGQWAALVAQVDALLGDDAPSLARVSVVLDRLLRAVTVLLGPQGVREPDDVSTLQLAGASAGAGAVVPLSATDVPVAVPRSAVASVGTAAVAGTTIASRDHAYQMLATIADYLAQQEPHSPTPYLLRRAVVWGRMPLPELMREVAREEGGLGRYLSMLGLD